MAQLLFPLADDVTIAEDMAATLAASLQAIMDNDGFDTRAQAIDALAEFAGYCRAACGYLDDGECHAPDPDRCGCICGHTDELDPLSRDVLRPHLDHPPTNA